MKRKLVSVSTTEMFELWRERRQGWEKIAPRMWRGRPVYVTHALRVFRAYRRTIRNAVEKAFRENKKNEKKILSLLAKGREKEARKLMRATWTVR